MIELDVTPQRQHASFGDPSISTSQYSRLPGDCIFSPVQLACSNLVLAHQNYKSIIHRPLQHRTFHTDCILLSPVVMEILFQSTTQSKLCSLEESLALGYLPSSPKLILRRNIYHPNAPTKSKSLLQSFSSSRSISSVL